MALSREGGPLVVVLFLLLAVATQVLLALYGLLSRYAQIIPSPSVPALRLVVIVNLIAEATLVLFHLVPLLVAKHVRQWRQRGRAQPSLPFENGSAAASGRRPPKLAEDYGSSSEASEATGSPRANATACETAAGRPKQPGCAAVLASITGPASEIDVEQPRSPRQRQPGGPEEHQEQQEQQQELQGSTCSTKLQQSKSTVRPALPLARGLSHRFERWQQRRPVLHRRLALVAITVTFTGCCSFQLLAPGYVDVSIVMLTTQWTTLCIALTQALLLRHRLPRAFWPSAFVMLGGAAMVIIPAVRQSTAGSLSTARGWFGFAMAIGALISTVAYYILLQACRHMGFTPLQLQHCMNIFSILLYLPLTLPINGANWGTQFAGWSAVDWVALVGLSTAAYLGSGMLMQLCVWRLGAPTASMFFGLRLVFSVVLSTPILGSTIIQTGVQIAGVVITSLAVTVYAATQWWASRMQQKQQQEQEQEQEHEHEHELAARKVQEEQPTHVAAEMGASKADLLTSEEQGGQ